MNRSFNPQSCRVTQRSLVCRVTTSGETSENAVNANFRELRKSEVQLPRIPLPRTRVNKGEGYLAAVRRPYGILPILDDQLSISAVGSYREDEDARPLGTGILVEDYPVMQGDHSGEYSFPCSRGRPDR